MLDKLIDLLVRWRHGMTLMTLTAQYHEAGRDRGIELGQDSAVDNAIKQNDPRIEAVKRDFLQRGYERGKTAMRRGLIFDLYLHRSDTGDMEGGDGQAEYHRKMQIAGGALTAATEGPQYAWWAVMGPRDIDGERCIGDLATMEPHQALVKYLTLLDETVLDSALRERLALPAEPPKTRQAKEKETGNGL